MAEKTAALPQSSKALEAESAFSLQRAHSAVVRKSTADDRIEKLTRLKEALLAWRAHIKQALMEDFRKAPEEVDLTEIFPVLLEIKHAVRNVGGWMKARKVRTPLPLFGTASEILYEPKGVVLIISPWNYPVNLTLGPLVSAIAAGNCAVLKPSEFTPATSEVLRKLVHDTFSQDEVVLLEGDHTMARDLLALPFDHVFFTGSTRVGRLVMKAAADHISSVTLELGGKSPTIVDPSANVERVAEAIAWGKFSNAGQTCVAPDFAIVHESIVDELIGALRRAFDMLFGNVAVDVSADFARIVDERHFERLRGLIKDAIAAGAECPIGGGSVAGSRMIEPTVLTNVPPEADIMEEEIFGPVLPVLPYRRPEEAVELLNGMPTPLALYVFSTDEARTEYFISNTRSGGVVVNDVSIHFANPELPFGGHMTSGIGRSHGHAGFLAFSNQRAVMRQRLKNPPTRLLYPPYGGRTTRLVDWLLRLFA